MKLATETKPNKEVWIKPMEFELPAGLIGFPDVTKYELLVNEEELPFMWIRSVEHHELGFVVIEPSEILNDYEIELPYDDVEKLAIAKEEDALILNIVTIKDGASLDDATVNLIGPLVLNRQTMVGKQIIVQNYMSLSARHSLLSSSVKETSK